MQASNWPASRQRGRGTWPAASNYKTIPQLFLSLEAAAKFCSAKQLIPKITHFHEADKQTDRRTGRPQAKRFEVAAAGLVACLIADFLPDLAADNASPRPEQNSTAQLRTGPSFEKGRPFPFALE